LVQHDRCVPYLVGRISRAVSSAASALYRERLGIGLNEARVVLSLARRPRIIAKDLAEDTTLDKSTISRTLDVLRKGRWVRYVEGRGRGALALTRAGRALHARISRVALRREDLMLRGLSANERATLIEYLTRLLRNLPRANRCDPLSRRAQRKA
jgi:DNA-binding MarR family transcriptional regulator